MNSFISFAQDVQFTQFYAASVYMNPAFAGSSHYNRGYLHQRVQWPGLEARYLTSMVGFDGYSEKYRSGFGGYALFDFQGMNVYASRELQLQYTFEVPLSESLVFKPALQLGFVSKSLNDLNLVFPDQYNSNGYIGSHDEDLLNYNVMYPDISSGFILHNQNFWIGLSAHHMNRPEVSLLDGNSSRWPVRFAAIGGYKFLLNNGSKDFTGDDISLVPSFHFKTQGKSDQLDVGVYLNYQMFVTGLWYRGIPVKKYDSHLHNNESMAMLVGFVIERWRGGYSYDFVVSRLSPARTHGAHEISLSYTLSPKKRRNMRKRNPCPDI